MQLTTPDVKTVQVNAVELSYVESGSGQTIVLVHGSTGDYRSWAGQMEPFSKDHRVIAYSRRYHWPNRWSVDVDAVAYTMEQHAGDLSGLIQALGLKQVILVGHSYGASVALLAAVRHPECIAKLVLAEPLMMLPNPALASLQADREGVEERVRQAFVADDPIGALAEFGNWFGGLLSWEQTPEAVRQRKLDNSASLRLQVNAGANGAAKLTCEDLKKLALPVLLLRGELTKPLFRLALEDIAACLPHVRVVEIARAGHGMVSDNPQEFNEKVLNFLAEL